MFFLLAIIVESLLQSFSDNFETHDIINSRHAAKLLKRESVTHLITFDNHFHNSSDHEIFSLDEDFTTRLLSVFIIFFFILLI
jgi:phosphoribosylpyrophosphate synthetase